MLKLGAGFYHLLLTPQVYPILYMGLNSSLWRYPASPFFR